MQQIQFKATNKQLVELLQGLYNVQSLQGLKFALLVSKNVKIIKDELNDIEDIAQPTPEFSELANKVRQFEEKKDSKAIKKLEKDNKKIVDERKKQLAELQEIMKEPVDLNLIPIEEKVLPENITAGQLTGIQTLIK